ncbi:B-cell receptor CD22-like isoform X2 [Eleginops maclovinus]|uniref:B-cell receptor CD22-like isoform X2 n=1 Tax=Eleginops maclovinus TaxID=56733 RepID=UPI003080EE66
MFYSLTEMRGAAMSLTAAASGLVVFLLSVSGVQGQDVWGVTYSSTEICAVKGSTVEINCRYTYPSRWRGGVNTVEKTFWFTKQKDGEPVDLRTDSEYAGRVETLCKNNICTLRIRNLRESDSAQYRFRFKTNQEGFEGSPGVTLSVTDLQVTSPSNRLYCQSRCPYSSNPSYIWYKNQEIIQGQTSDYTEHQNNGDSYSCALRGHEDFPSPPMYAPKLPSVSVSPSAEIEEGSSVTLTCSSDANPAAKYTWYKENQKLLIEKPQLVLSSIRSSDSGQYYCTAENKLGKRSTNISIDVKYAPKLPSVSVSPSAEIEEGSSVTLTCSSDANPAANYTWYKENQTLPLGREGSYHFTSISSEDRGIYYCKSENQYGVNKSLFQHINVQYAPKLPSVSVSPSAEIEEGSSVTLTCSSDANPAANYTWYKENQTLPLGREGSYHFTSISSEDRGNYYCKSENQYGVNKSLSQNINVQYAPKLPSVSVSPSAEIEEGSSVTLTCSSDANPAANYTWYKENEDSSKASGQIFNITDFRAEHSGSYSCEAQNKLGRSNSTLHKICGTASWKLPAAVTIPVVLLAVISLSVFLWIRRKSASRDSSEPAERADNREEPLPDQPEEQGDLQYATIHFSNSRAEPLYSNMRSAQPLRHTEQQEVPEYAAVKLKSAAPRPRGQDSAEDPAALYSTVNKSH